MPKLMTGTGKYVYCIIRCSEEREFDCISSTSNSPKRIYTMLDGDMAVVVSDSDSDEHRSTRENLITHQKVQEMVMKDFTLLPVRFGTIANSDSPERLIQQLLNKRHKEFSKLLNEMEGKVELGIKALWKDERAVLEEIILKDRSIRKLRNQLQKKSSTKTYSEQIKFGKMIKEALDKRRETVATRLLAPLKAIAVRTVENPVIYDRMIINAAFLVEKEREKEFDRAAKDLEQNNIQIKYVGPVPPYNFVNIVVNWKELEVGNRR